MSDLSKIMCASYSSRYFSHYSTIGLAKFTYYIKLFKGRAGHRSDSVGFGPKIAKPKITEAHNTEPISVRLHPRIGRVVVESGWRVYGRVGTDQTNNNFAERKMESQIKEKTQKNGDFK